MLCAELFSELKSMFDSKCDLVDYVGNVHGNPLSGVIGILFANPDDRYVKDEILSTNTLGIYHRFSGKYVNFFFAGYSYYHRSEYSVKVTELGNQSWYFDASLFKNFVEDFQKETTWTYSGSPELILLEHDGERFLYEHSMIIRLDRLGEIGISNLFQTIFNTAKHCADIEDLRRGVGRETFRDMLSFCFDNWVYDHTGNIGRILTFREHDIMRR